MYYPSPVSYMFQTTLPALMRARSDVADIRPSVPRGVRIRLVGILDLAHGGTTTADAAAHIGATAASVHDVEGKRGDECGPSEPEEGGGGLGLTAVLLGVCRAVEDFVGSGVRLCSVS
jgi:hypothetical protein